MCLQCPLNAVKAQATGTSRRTGNAASAASGETAAGDAAAPTPASTGSSGGGGSGEANPSGDRDGESKIGDRSVTEGKREEDDDGSQDGAQ